MRQRSRSWDLGPGSVLEPVCEGSHTTARAQSTLGWLAITAHQRQPDLDDHVTNRLDRHPEMAAALCDELLQRAKIDARLDNHAPRARAGFNVVKLQGSVRSGGAPAFRYRDKSVGAEPDVGMLGSEVPVHHDRAELDLQPPAKRHAFASIGSQVHEKPSDALGSSIHVERR